MLADCDVVLNLENVKNTGFIETEMQFGSKFTIISPILLFFIILYSYLCTVD